MKYFLLIAALISACESGCPSMCNCSFSAVLCMEKNLESVPSFESLTNDPLIIDLSGNKINMVDSDDFSFDKSDRVIEIYLNNTELFDIDSEAFAEVENLQELYLGDNLLNKIPENLIEDLHNMVLLEISNNHFSGDFPKIISKSLEVLAVANSKVSSLPIDSLKYLPNLKMLLLQQNNIKYIDSAVFDNVNENSFFVRLSYNVWDCSCENIKLFEYLAGRKFIDTSDPYQCLTTTGTYVDIYKNENIEYLKNTCSTKVIKDLTSFKENRLTIEAEEQLKEENDDNIDSDKPYALVKESDDTLMDEPLNIQPFENEGKAILDEYKDDEEYVDIIERETITENTGDASNIDLAEYEESMLSKINFDKNLSSFVIVFCSFVVGVIFGFCLNQLTMLRYRNLESSDSRAKLILS